jgi:hypothetical protein
VRAVSGPYQGGVRYSSHGERFAVTVMAAIPVIVLVGFVGSALDPNTHLTIGWLVAVVVGLAAGLAVTAALLRSYCYALGPHR